MEEERVLQLGRSRSPFGCKSDSLDNIASGPFLSFVEGVTYIFDNIAGLLRNGESVALERAKRETTLHHGLNNIALEVFL